MVLGEVGHALPLREILAEQAVDGFVGAAFPRMGAASRSRSGPRLVRSSAVYSWNSVPLSTVMGPHRAGLGVDELARPLVHGRARALA